jgi:hypothetical protein
MFLSASGKRARSAGASTATNMLVSPVVGMGREVAAIALRPTLKRDDLGTMP